MAVPKKSLFDRKKTHMTDDPLQFLLKLLGVEHQKSLGLLCAFVIRVILFWVGMNVVSINVIIGRGELKQYATLFAVSLPCLSGTLSMIGNVSQLPILKTAYNYCWPINCCGERVEKRILNTCKQLRVFSMFLVAMCLISHLVCSLPIVGDESRINPTIKMADLRLADWSKPLILPFYYVGIVIFSYGLAYPIMFGLYEVFQLHFQLELLNEHLLTISDDYESLDDSYLDDEEYQRVIGERLRVCVKHHINILNLTKIYQHNVKYTMLFLPPGAIAPVAALSFIYNKISPPSNFRMIFVLALSSILAASLSIAGQKLNNSNEKLFRVACECPWVYWNKQNKRTLLILLTMSMKPISFSSYAGIELNLQLLMKYVRWMYSLVTLFQ